MVEQFEARLAREAQAQEERFRKTRASMNRPPPRRGVCVVM